MKFTSQIKFIDSLNIEAIKPNSFSWCAVSENHKIVVFSVWDDLSNDEVDIVLDEEWSIKKNGHKSPNYPYARKGVKLIEEDTYKLWIYRKYRRDIHSDVAQTWKFESSIEEKILKKKGKIWYAYPKELLVNSKNYPDEISEPELYTEGAKISIIVNAYERNPEARKKCLEAYGYDCKGCGFNFEKIYGIRGKDFIHVHHIKSLKSIGESYQCDPIKDLIPLCPNCHAIVHRGSEILEIEELRAIHFKLL